MKVVVGTRGRDGSAGTVAGTLVRQGGPASGSAVTLPGGVGLTNLSTGRQYSTEAASDVRFAIVVPAGTYRVQAESPLVRVDGREMLATVSRALRVRHGKTTEVNVYFSVR